MTSLIGTLKSPLGGNATGTLTLTPPVNTSLYGGQGNGPQAQIVITVTNGVLQSPPAIIGNDLVLPHGTQYSVRFVDSNSRVSTAQWYIAGSTFDVGSSPLILTGSGVDATQLWGRDIFAAAPADGNVLAWSAANNRWEPTVGGGGGGLAGTIAAGQIAFGSATDTIGGSANLEWIPASIAATVSDLSTFSADAQAYLAGSPLGHVDVHITEDYTFGAPDQNSGAIRSAVEVRGTQTFNNPAPIYGFVSAFPALGETQSQVRAGDFDTTTTGEGTINLLSNLMLYSDVEGSVNVLQRSGIVIYFDANFNGGNPNVQNDIGIDIQAVGYGTAENIGIQIADITGATNNWAIKTGLGLVEHADSVLINQAFIGRSPFTINSTASDPATDFTNSPLVSASFTFTPSADYAGGGPGVFVISGATAGAHNLANTQWYNEFSIFTHGSTGTLLAAYGHETILITSPGSGNITGVFSDGKGLYGYDVFTDLEGGNVATLVGYHVSALSITAPATVTNNFAFYADDQTGATNSYYSWFGSRGVRRVKEDSTFDSVGQAIEALYNPQFTKYTPGAANYERIILGQWNGNVAEIGTEKGGTGTLRPLRLIGSEIHFGASASAWWDVSGETLHIDATSQNPLDVEGLAPGDGNIYGIYTFLDVGGHTIDKMANIQIDKPSLSGGSITGYFYGLEFKDLSGVNANLTYYTWMDSRGVMRVKEDAAYNGTGQAILALYNNAFTKYTPGSANFERGYFAWDNANVFDFGAEAGGTGTLRDLRLKGANIRLAAKPQFDAANSTGGGTALLGSNSPSAHLSAPYTWIDVLAADGTLCTMPIWQK